MGKEDADVQWLLADSKDLLAIVGVSLVGVGDVLLVRGSNK